MMRSSAVFQVEGVSAVHDGTRYKIITSEPSPLILAGSASVEVWYGIDLPFHCKAWGDASKTDYAPYWWLYYAGVVTFPNYAFNSSWPSNALPVDLDGDYAKASAHLQNWGGNHFNTYFMWKVGGVLQSALDPSVASSSQGYYTTFDIPSGGVTGLTADVARYEDSTAATAETCVFQLFDDNASVPTPTPSPSPTATATSTATTTPTGTSTATPTATTTPTSVPAAAGCRVYLVASEVVRGVASAVTAFSYSGSVSISVGGSWSSLPHWSGVVNSGLYLPPGVYRFAPTDGGANNRLLLCSGAPTPTITPTGTQSPTPTFLPTNTPTGTPTPTLIPTPTIRPDCATPASNIPDCTIIELLQTQIAMEQTAQSGGSFDIGDLNPTEITSLDLVDVICEREPCGGVRDTYIGLGLVIQKIDQEGSAPIDCGGLPSIDSSGPFALDQSDVNAGFCFFLERTTKIRVLTAAFSVIVMVLFLFWYMMMTWRRLGDV
jgi:hypothetical protein